ncbi:MAG: hypothetical protein ACRDJF_04670 [Actinomycetota bacterium]
MIGRSLRPIIPVPVTVTQLAVLAVSTYLLLKTSRHWTPMIAPYVHPLLVQAGIPIGLTVAIRWIRIEGRSPARFLLALVTLLGTWVGEGVGRARRRDRNRWEKMPRTRCHIQELGELGQP